MSEDRKRILDMLAEGKITAAEADLLLDSLESTAAQATARHRPPPPRPTGPRARPPRARFRSSCT